MVLMDRTHQPRKSLNNESNEYDFYATIWTDQFYCTANKYLEENQNDYPKICKDVVFEDCRDMKYNKINKHWFLLKKKKMK